MQREFLQPLSEQGAVDRIVLINHQMENRVGYTDFRFVGVVVPVNEQGFSLHEAEQVLYNHAIGGQLNLVDVSPSGREKMDAVVVVALLQRVEVLPCAGSAE